MMYQTLAHFYDALVKDDEATADWVAFIQQHATGERVLELACGSGEITLALARKGYQIDASDLSEDMIDMAMQKDGSTAIAWSIQDMRNLSSERSYEIVLCLCDSFNYILNEMEIQEMFHNIYGILENRGTYIMDMHSLDRLEEFQEEFFEDGIIDGNGYQWTIHSDEDRIYQNFAFYDKNGSCTLEQHVQRVYDPLMIQQMLEDVGFHVQIYTDFTKHGIHAGEKYFYVCRKDVNV